MSEFENIIQAYHQAKETNLTCVLATVVHVEGSSYRRAGARMLVDQNGFMTGAISGGCLEGDALRRALFVTYQKQNKLITYDTGDEEDAVIGAQLGCNGIIQVLFEPIDYSNPNNPIELLKQALEANENSVLVSLFNFQKDKKQIGTQLLTFKDETVGGIKEYPTLEKKIIQDSIQCIKNGVSSFNDYQTDENSCRAFLQLMTKPIHLVIVGAGNDAQVLASMAEHLGWQITVTDGRATHANKERFIGTCQIVVTNASDVLNDIQLTEKTAFVLMTHNYNYDLAVLKLLLNESVLPYIGILGPKKKFERMVDDLFKMGVEISEKQMEKIYAPIGLEINAETPSEIALSILPEIQKVISLAKGGHLRDKKGRIHEDHIESFENIPL